MMLGLPGAGVCLWPGLLHWLFVRDMRFICLATTTLTRHRKKKLTPSRCETPVQQQGACAGRRHQAR